MPNDHPTDFRVCLVNPPVLAVRDLGMTPTFGVRHWPTWRAACASTQGFPSTSSMPNLSGLRLGRYGERLKTLNPHVVGFSGVYQRNKTRRLPSRLAWKMDSRPVVTVVGGARTALPKETLAEFRSFDLGWWAKAKLLYELCDALRRGISLTTVPALVMRENGTLHQTAHRERILDQDSISFLGWDLAGRRKRISYQSCADVRTTACSA